MPKDMHEKAAEHHEQTAKTHRTAARNSTALTTMWAQSSNLLKPSKNPRQLTSIRRRQTI
jgi:hypothetical protein